MEKKFIDFEEMLEKFASNCKEKKIDAFVFLLRKERRNLVSLHYSVENLRKLLWLS